MRNFLNKVSLNQIDSFDRVLVFKHSRTCPVSARALREVEQFMEGDPSDIPVLLIDVLTDRGYSMEVAEHLNIKHESPQLIFLEKGEMKWNDSHFGVSASKITSVVES